MKPIPETWYNRLEVVEEPYPHIPEGEILAAMPEELHNEWDSFMYGQTTLVREDGQAGIYPCDLIRFVIRSCRKNAPKLST